MFSFLIIAQRDGHALRPCASGSADAVDVGLGLARQIEVQDMRDAVDIDPASRDVGRDQHFGAAGLEVGQRPLAGRLALVAVERIRRDARPIQLAGDAIGPVFRAGEDQRPA